MTGRMFNGCDVDAEYVQMANERVKMKNDEER